MQISAIPYGPNFPIAEKACHGDGTKGIAKQAGIMVRLAKELLPSTTAGEEQSGER